MDTIEIIVNKQTNHPTLLVTELWNAAPGEVIPLLTRVHVTRSDLLLVFAAGKLGAFEPLLHSHVALLNPTSAHFGAF